VAFDAYTIFDPRPIFALVEKLYPGKGTEFGRCWRNKQFDYAWIRLLAGHYEDFWKITQDALVYTAHMQKVELTREKREGLLAACLSLKAWEEVPLALKTLGEMDVKIAFLSNFSPLMLGANIKSAGLEDMFDEVISTDAAKTYKPAPAAYQLALDTLSLKREEILFCPFAGWDTAGAKLFGLKTFWVNRLNLPVEELGAQPDAQGTSLADVVSFVRG
jgi:2-haloacid dehalogenase